MDEYLSCYTFNKLIHNGSHFHHLNSDYSLGMGRRPGRGVEFGNPSSLPSWKTRWRGPKLGLVINGPAHRNWKWESGLWIDQLSTSLGTHLSLAQLLLLHWNVTFLAHPLIWSSISRSLWFWIVSCSCKMARWSHRSCGMAHGEHTLWHCTPLWDQNSIHVWDSSTHVNCFILSFIFSLTSLSKWRKIYKHQRRNKTCWRKLFFKNLFIRKQLLRVIGSNNDLKNRRCYIRGCRAAVWFRNADLFLEVDKTFQ